MAKRKTYASEFKVKVVLESIQRDTTIEQVRQKYQIPTTNINKWRMLFKKNAHKAFDVERKLKKGKPEESATYLKSIIGDLTVENALLKKALSVWG